MRYRAAFGRSGDPGWPGYDAEQRMVASTAALFRAGVLDVQHGPDSLWKDTTMLSTKDIVTAYYELLTAGDCDAWCDLFASDQVMDEQLIGHVEGKDTLRDMITGFPGNTYASFEKRPRHVVVDGDTAAVVSHIHGVTHEGAIVDADVADYFETKNGQITYMANFHDTVPFAVLSDK